jgi:hypothetical protein
MSELSSPPITLAVLGLAAKYEGPIALPAAAAAGPTEEEDKEEASLQLLCRTNLPPAA